MCVAKKTTRINLNVSLQCRRFLFAKRPSTVVYLCVCDLHHQVTHIFLLVQSHARFRTILFARVLSSAFASKRISAGQRRILVVDSEEAGIEDKL